MPFLDFQIRAWTEGTGHAKVLVHCSPAGAMRRPVDVPLMSDTRERLQQVFGHNHAWISADPTVRGQVIALGLQLSQTLLPTPVYLLLVRSLERLLPGDGLRLRLCLEQTLSDIPWEFLYRPDMTDSDALAGFLVLDPRISLVREAPTNTDPIPESAPQQKLVFAGAFWTANEGVLEDRWQVKSEFEQIRNALNPLREILTLEFHDASDQSFESMLTQTAAVIHYSGNIQINGQHGYLVRRMGARGLVSTRMFSTELGFLLRKAQTRLGVFGACNSGRWAFVEPLLQAGLPALVGTHALVTNVGCIAFARKLYAALAVGLSLDEAATWARLHLLVNNGNLEDESAVPAAPSGTHRDLVPTWTTLDEEDKDRQSYEWGSFIVFMTSAEPILLPQPNRPEILQVREAVQRERRQTIVNVYQTIGTASGTVTGLSSGQIGV